MHNLIYPAKPDEYNRSESTNIVVETAANLLQHGLNGYRLFFYAEINFS
jgi:hypothetical protein